MDDACDPYLAFHYSIWNEYKWPWLIWLWNVTQVLGACTWTLCVSWFCAAGLYVNANDWFCKFSLCFCPNEARICLKLTLCVCVYVFLALCVYLFFFHFRWRIPVFDPWWENIQGCTKEVENCSRRGRLAFCYFDFCVLYHVMYYFSVIILFCWLWSFSVIWKWHIGVNKHSQRRSQMSSNCKRLHTI